MDAAPIVVIAKIVVKRGRRDELIKLLGEVVEQDKKETGTIVQAFQSERDNPDVIWEYNVYKTVEDLELHRKNIAPMIAKMVEADLIEQWPYRTFLTPIDAKGIEF